MSLVIYFFINCLTLQDFLNFGFFAYHCKFARLNQELRRYLLKLDVLYDKFITAELEHQSIKSITFLRLMVDIFQILRREVGNRTTTFSLPVLWCF